MEQPTQAAPAPSPPAKDFALESVRGIAALVVVNWHFVELFNEIRDPRISQQPFARALAWLRNGPFTFAFDGQLAVFTFFVLSGYVLSLGFAHDKSGNYAGHAAIRRLPRLAIPAAASIVLSHLLMTSGLYFHRDVIAEVDILDHSRALADFQFEPSWRRVLRDATLVFQQAGESNLYNRSLWTMHIELAGSMLVFMLHAFFRQPRQLALALGALLLWQCRFAQWRMLDFSVGVGLFLLHRALADADTPNAKLVAEWTRRLIGPICVLSLVLEPGPMEASPRLGHFSILIPAAAVVAAGLESQTTRRLLNLRPLVFLGRVSFALYLLHIPLIFSVSMWTFSRTWRAGFGYPACFMAAFGALLIVLLPLSELFTRVVDSFALRISKQISAYVMGERRRRRVESPVPAAVYPERGSS